MEVSVEIVRYGSTFQEIYDQITELITQLGYRNPEQIIQEGQFHVSVAQYTLEGAVAVWRGRFVCPGRNTSELLRRATE